MSHAQDPVVGALPLLDFTLTLSATYERGPPILALHRFIVDFFINYVSLDTITGEVWYAPLRFGLQHSQDIFQTSN